MTTRPRRAEQPAEDLQLRQGGGIDLAPDLAEFESQQAAERLRRLAEDQELINTLQWISFDRTSEEWRKLAQALIEYGYSVFVGWAVAGVLYQRAHARDVQGLQHLPEGLRLRPDEAHGLAVTLLVERVESFRMKVLATHKWTSRGGASLKTYFVGWCLFGLPGAYRRWCRGEEPVPAIPDNLEADRRAAHSDPELRGLAAAELEELRRGLGDPLAWEMLELFAAGYSYDLIAEMLDTTEGAVRTRLSRARTLLRGRYGHDATA